MPIGLKEAKMGLYRAVQDGETHIALNIKEWNDYVDVYNSNKQMKSKLKQNKDHLIQAQQQLEKLNAERSRVREYLQNQQDLEEELQRLRKIASKLQEENEELKKENARLDGSAKKVLRMQKERANSQRDLHPKRDHVGYIFLMQERVLRRIAENDKRPFSVLRTVLQCPIFTACDRHTALEIFEKDMEEKLRHILKIDHYRPEIQYLTDKYTKTPEQIVYDIELKRNGKTKFYEVVLYHLWDFEFPDEMLM